MLLAAGMPGYSQSTGPWQSKSRHMILFTVWTPKWGDGCCSGGKGLPEWTCYVGLPVSTGVRGLRAAWVGHACC